MYYCPTLLRRRLDEPCALGVDGVIADSVCQPPLAGVHPDLASTKGAERTCPSRVAQAGARAQLTFPVSAAGRATRTFVHHFNHLTEKGIKTMITEADTHI